MNLPRVESRPVAESTAAMQRTIFARMIGTIARAIVAREGGRSGSSQGRGAA